MVSADLNHDSKPDLIISNNLVNTISVLINNGARSFAPVVTYYAGGPEPRGIAVADFNEDGKLDVVVGTVSGFGVLLGNGDGTLQPVVKYDSRSLFQKSQKYPADVDGIGVADFIGDGHLDLVLGVPGANAINVFRGDGTGSFSFYKSLGQFNGSGNIVVADFNKDGEPDFVLARPQSGFVAVYLGIGDANFNATSYPIGAGGYSVAVADLNHDGILDLGITLDKNIGVLLGNPDGTFQPVLKFPTSSPNAICTGDINADGNVDLVLSSSDGMSVVYGNGIGGFTSTVNYAAGSHPWGCSVLDANADGRLDITIADYDNKNVALYIAQADHSFLAAKRYDLRGQPSSVALGDINNDGKLDAVFDISLAPYVNLAILPGRGDGTFLPVKPISTGTNFGDSTVALADLNRDGKLDIAWAPRGYSTVFILLGNGDGTFQPAKSFDVNPQATDDNILLGDFNGDGFPDLAISSYDSVFIALGKGDSTFNAAVWYASGSGVRYSATADFNRDGKLDIVFSNSYNNSLSVFLGNGDGTFRVSKISLNISPASVAVADMNSDAKLDVVMSSSTGLYLLAGNGDGSFQSPVSISTVSGFITAADVSEDHKPDLIVANASGVTILTGKGDGTVNPPRTYPAGYNPIAAAVADLNGDKAPDLVIAPHGAMSAIVLLNAGATTVTLTSSPNPSVDGQTVTFIATVKPVLNLSPTPTGKITFKSGNTTLGIVSLSGGKASLQVSTLTPGSHGIKAYYSGDSTFIPNSSATVTQKVQ